MKTKLIKAAKTFDAVKSMREIRDKISLDIAVLNLYLQVTMRKMLIGQTFKRFD